MKSVAKQKAWTGLVYINFFSNFLIYILANWNHHSPKEVDYLQLPSWNLNSHLQNAISTHKHTGSCTRREKYGVHSWQAGTGCLVPLQIGRGEYTSFRVYFSYYFFCVSFFFFLQKELEIKLKRATKVILEILTPSFHLLPWALNENI